MNLTITPNFTQYKNSSNPNVQSNMCGGGGGLSANHFKNFSARGLKLPGLLDAPAVNNTLAPLSRDTVSFGAGLRADKILSQNAFHSENLGGLNMEMATGVTRRAEAAMQYLETTVKRYLSKLISSNEADKPIQELQFRIKGGKETFKKGAAVSERRGITIENSEELKGIVEDLIGGRIILREDTKGAVKKVLQSLGKAVQDGKLPITQIEIHRPIVDEVPVDIVKRFRRDLGINLDDKKIKEMQKRDFFSYAAPNDIQEFKRICRGRFRNLEFSENDSPVGYQAIHLRVSLPNGYTGEIQIMGRDVEAFKEFEDVYYKAKGGKIDKDRYPETAKRLSCLAPLKSDGDTPISEAEKLEWQFRQDTMQDYTFWTYIGQRLKGEKGYKSKVSEKFLVAPQYLLDQGLGFNQMAPVIRADRAAYKAAQKAKNG